MARNNKILKVSYSASPNYPIDWLETVGGVEFPLFNMVYHDCVMACGKYRYDIRKAGDIVLWHLACGNPLNYHQITPGGLYWKNAEQIRPPALDENLPTLVVPQAVYCRGDNGWGQDLQPADRFIKNTYEMVSPLHRLTAKMLITDYIPLSEDFKITKTIFGDNQVDVVVNRSEKTYTCKLGNGSECVLPPFGFVVESDTFRAFHALSYNGLKYDRSAMFTVRSLDDKPLKSSSKLRVFHGFGSERIKLRGKIHSIPRQKDLSP